MRRRVQQRKATRPPEPRPAPVPEPSPEEQALKRKQDAAVARFTGKNTYFLTRVLLLRLTLVLVAAGLCVEQFQLPQPLGPAQPDPTVYNGRWPVWRMATFPGTLLVLVCIWFGRINFTLAMTLWLLYLTDGDMFRLQSAAFINVLGATVEAPEQLMEITRGARVMQEGPGKGHDVLPITGGLAIQGRLIAGALLTVSLVLTPFSPTTFPRKFAWPLPAWFSYLVARSAVASILLHDVLRLVRFLIGSWLADHHRLLLLVLLSPLIVFLPWRRARHGFGIAAIALRLLLYIGPLTRALGFQPLHNMFYLVQLIQAAGVFDDAALRSVFLPSAWTEAAVAASEQRYPGILQRLVILVYCGSALASAMNSILNSVNSTLLPQDAF